MIKKLIKWARGAWYLIRVQQDLNDWWDHLRIGQKYRIHKTECPDSKISQLK
jgi:hypothetical protein